MKSWIVFGLTIVGFFAPAASASPPDFLEDLSHRSFSYFLDHSDPQTGLVLDRAPFDGSTTKNSLASIAATGFGLTAFISAAENHWIDRDKARLHILTALRFLRPLKNRVHGWYYHWMDIHTGERVFNSEISSIDTSFFLAGVLTARQYFSEDREIVKLATELYEEVDFKWMLADDQKFLSHGWYPETGFIKYRWDEYSELMLLNILAVASPTHGIDPSSWSAWKRDWTTYDGNSYVQSAGSLFIHQYSMGWLDLRKIKENFGAHVDWFENSKAAVLAQKAFCLSLSKEFKSYSENSWGITASDSANGYVAWGGPPRDPHIDGTIVPSALTGSLMFSGPLVLDPIKKLSTLGSKISGPYGFANAFNPLTGWVGPDELGIDVGITLLSVENFRNQSIWNSFMKNPEIENALVRVGFIPD